MTNPETRKARQAAAAQKLQNQANGSNGRNELVLDEMECITPTWNRRRDVAAEELIDDEDSITPTPDSDDLDEEGELSLDTCSSFSLQECIDEFKARRMRRISTHSRDVVTEKDAAQKLDPAEEDLINQNRCNKEQERKCKPCKNGFCYCFTSDSGDAMGDGVERPGAHVRQNRRSRKSESSQVSNAQLHTKSPQPKERRRQSAPPGLKGSNSPKKSPTKPSIAPLGTSKDQITAISRLETSSRDAPLIHIIQELHNNCVISEVRVNKHKIQAQRSRSLSSKPSPKKTHFILPEPKTKATKLPSRSPRKSLPSAPPLDKISELDSLSERFVYSTSLNSSAKSNDSPGRRHKAAGLLLQKRLSQTNTQYKPRNLNEPPPKPPRCSFSNAEDKTSISTLASTTPSLRAAERVLDDFLLSKGVALPGANAETQRRQSKERKERANEKAKKQQQQQEHQISKLATNKEKRKSYPLIQLKPKTHFRKPLPSCPSLSDIERMVDDTKKPSTNYEKNIRHFAEKPIKEHSFGWKEREPDIHQMLNYDSNANKRKFRSQAVQAEPQTIGWHIPPKMTLDTVDGEVRSNLAVNISKKATPVKTRLPLNAQQKAEETQKFILSEQLKSFVQSPWSNKSNKNNNAATKKLKSSLKSCSRSFLNNSKKRILRLVSPKKDNREPRSEPFAVRRTPLRSIGIQTSREELRSYETSSTPQSPPGSYFSAVQTSQQSSSTPTQDTQDQPADSQHFDFNRKVHSPPKRPKPVIQRKLNFPLSRNSADDGGRAHDEHRLGGGDATMTKTYRSFQDQDQDVLSKMGYILSNIRAKLEASDDHAVRTFQEIERREQQIADGFDYPDSAAPQMRHQTRVDLHRNNRNFAIVQTEHDPIYSEIEEDSMHISSSPQFDSKTGIEHFPAARDPTALYAKVTKRPSKPSRAAKKSASAAEQQLPSPSTSLAQCMRDSLKSKITLKPLPPLPATPQHAASTFSASSCAPHSQSLNNIRVMEHNSPPKRHRHLSKSDLSLQRSEIFLENLCRSEIIINAASLEPLEKVQNSQLDESSYISINSCDLPTQSNSVTRTVEEKDEDDEVSYELPHDAEQDDVCHAAAGSQLGLSHFDPPDSTNQSTPKKSHAKSQTFKTKPATLQADAQQQLNLDISIDDCLPSTHQSNSCPNTPHRLPTKPVDVLDNECSTSLIEVTATSRADKTQPNNNKSALARYQQLKNVLRKSLRKSKKFVKTETKRLSSSLSFPAAPTSIVSINKLHQSEIQQCEELLTSSSLNLDTLFSLDGAAEDQPLQHQLAKAVCICRQLPDLEISPEMVEAERLLLFSTLRRNAIKAKSGNIRNVSEKQKRFYVDAMRLPIRTDASQDLFFNYFYIGTFYCDGVIRSTQSVECRNNEAIFSDCGIEFACTNEAEVKCEIFMLRLRKVSTISLEPTKKSVMNLLTTSRSSVGSSCDDIVSRFRLHGSFTITSRNFVPYDYVELASKSSNSLCLRSSTSCKIAITPRTQSTNLATEMLLTGRAEVRFPKCTHSGFLNVQQPQNKHHWNRRWCTLDGLFVRVWQDVPVGSEQNEPELPPLMEFDLRLRIATGPMECATREQCARPRSFALDCFVTPAVDNAHTADSTVIFFVADTQNELNTWLLVLNKVVDFMDQWMK